MDKAPPRAGERGRRAGSAAGNFQLEARTMLRKLTMIAAALLVCTPFGGAGRVALGKCLGKVALPSFSARPWLGPYELAVASACLMVLALTTQLRRT